MNKLKSAICLALTAIFIFLFVSCKTKEKAVEPAETTVSEPITESVTEPQINFTADWFTAPSIQADSVRSLPTVRFNENTSHYEVTYGNAVVIEKDGKYGLLDSNGKKALDISYDSITTCTCYKGFLAVKKESEYYTSTYHIGPSLKKEIASAHSCIGFAGYKYMWNTSANKAECIYKSEYSNYPVSITPCLPETASVYDGENETGKYVLICDGKKVGNEEYDGAGVFTGGLAAVRKNGKWGYIDSQGKTVIPFLYDAIEGHDALKKGEDTPFECSEGYVTVCRNGKYGIYSSDGSLIVPFEYTYLTVVHDGRVFASKDGKNWGILRIDKKISDGIAETSDVTTTTAYNYYNYYQTQPTTAYSNKTTVTNSTTQTFTTTTTTVAYQ